MTWVDFVVRATIILTAAFAAAYAGRQASAAVRHFVWTAAFVAVLLLPLAMKVGPRFTVGGMTTAPTRAQAVALPGAKAAVPARKVPNAVPATQNGPGGSTVIYRAGVIYRTGAIYWAGLYLTGFLLVMGRFLNGAWRMGQMLRGARPASYSELAAAKVRAQLGIGRKVRVLESAAAGVPMTWGVRRPVVLLPETACDWPSGRIHAVLLHEMVHIARHDLAAQMAAQAACCLYWFHPLVWLAARQLRKERERACDDAVLGCGVTAPDYAGHLMELARVLVERQASLADAPAMAEAGDLEERVRALLDRGRNRAPLTRRVAVAVAVLACALMLPVATLTTYAQAGRGALAGIVQDPSGARVPRSAVTAKNLDGTNEEVAVANAAGEYGFAAIPAGRYTIEVRAAGFKIAKKEIVVVAGAASRADMALEIGSMSESVTIRAARAAPATPAARAMATPQRIPIGGNVQPAKLLTQVKPTYPPDLKQQGVTGVVSIRAIVSKQGELLNPQVVNTVNPGLAQAALDAVRQWRFQPTLLNGEPVETITNIDLSFELEGDLLGLLKVTGPRMRIR